MCKGFFFNHVNTLNSLLHSYHSIALRRVRKSQMYSLWYPNLKSAHMRTLIGYTFSVQSVSYTHLDVYKRQLIYMVRCCNVVSLGKQAYASREHGITVSGTYRSKSRCRIMNKCDSVTCAEQRRYNGLREFSIHICDSTATDLIRVE